MSALTQQIEPQAAPSPAPLPPRSRGRRIGAWITAAALLGGAAAAYQFWWKPKQEAAARPAVASARTAKVTRGPLERTIRLTGQTSARIFANITAPIQRGGDRQQMALLSITKGGIMVKKGDVVAEMDPQRGREFLDDIFDGSRQSANDMAKRRAEQAVEWESLQQTLRVAKASLDKAQLDLRTSPTRTEVERELLQLAVEEARARYEQQQKDQAFRKAGQAADLRVTEINAIRANQRLERMEQNLLRFILRAPMDGLVVMQNIYRGGEFTAVQLGDQMASGQPIMKIVDPGSMQVEATINQAQATDLRIGQRVRIGMDAFADLKLAGRIHSIGALAVGGFLQNYYIRNVPIRIAIESRDQRVIPDMSAYGDVVLERSDDALQVPRTALVSENGKDYVWVRGAAGFEKREVKLGLQNDTHTAVLAGLSLDEEVRLP